MQNSNQVQRVLVCGAGSFVGRQLVELLRGRGHVVTRFGRGSERVSGDSITGPVAQMHTNPHLTEPFDTVINFILLKDEPIEPNLVFMDSLLKFCLERGVKHLIHISSVSVYPGTARQVNETMGIETDPSQKGPYAGLKVVQDRFLIEHMPDGQKLKVTFVRPGFVLGPGLIDPMVGMAARLPWNKLLILGDAKNSLPVVRRDMVDEALVRLVENPPAEQGSAYLLLHPQSPSRKLWLAACCEVIGAGKGIVSVPRFLWRILGWGGGMTASVLGMKMKPGRVIRNALRVQWFDPNNSAKKLGMDFAFDWKVALRESMERQEPNFSLPYTNIAWKKTGARRVTFLGYGGIVKQKHLLALKWVGFTGDIQAFDLKAGIDEQTGQKITAIEGASIPESDLYVVASPGRAHNQAIGILQNAPAGTVMVEKPLCYSKSDLDQWLSFAAGRKQPVLVCHNYRFKQNVAQMLAHLSKYNAGALLHVDLNYQSPPVGKHFPAWRRAERESQTLLMEYSLHYLDLATMFDAGVWEMKAVRHTLNPAGETSLIQGELQSSAYTVSFLARQAICPRRAKLVFTFQNYTLSVGFFPDTFVAYMAPDTPFLHGMERKAASRAMGRKILDKLTSRDSDQSHPATYLAALEPSANLAAAIEVSKLKNFYELIFQMADAIYR